MSKPHVLLAESNQNERQVLEICLRKAGFVVTPCADGADAIDKLRLQRPDVVISSATLARVDGFALCRAVRSDLALDGVIFIFLTDKRRPEERITALQIGADDYLSKPIFVSELLARLHHLLDRRTRGEVSEAPQRRRGTVLAGRFTDLSIVDLIQMMSMGSKSGVIRLREDGGRVGALYVNGGQLVDAQVGDRIVGARAVHRILLWDDGAFEVRFEPFERARRIEAPTEATLMDGLRRTDEWLRLCEQLPPLGDELVACRSDDDEALAGLEESERALLALFDRPNTIERAIEASEADDDLRSLGALTRLYFTERLTRVEHLPATSPATTLPDATSHVTSTSATGGSIAQALGALVEPGSVIFRDD